MDVPLIIHIGPPKTATTSLQALLTSTQNDSVYYGGTSYPRHGNDADDSAAYFVRNAINHGSKEDAFERARQELSRRLEKYEKLVLSEEMFVLPEPDLPIDVKIARLSIICREFNSRIVITVRDISEVLPSLFQERYKFLAPSLQEDFGAFCRSDYAKCFDYSYLDSLLEQHGLHDRVYIKFEDLISGRVDFKAVFGLNLDSSATHLGRKNTANKSKGRRLLERMSLSERVLRSFNQQRPDWFPKLGMSKWFLKSKGRITTAETLEVPRIMLDDYWEFIARIFDECS